MEMGMGKGREGRNGKREGNWERLNQTRWENIKMGERVSSYLVGKAELGRVSSAGCVDGCEEGRPGVGHFLLDE